MEVGFRPFWPRVTGIGSAKTAARQGWQASFFLGGLYAVVASIATIHGPLLGFDRGAFVDAALMLITGWRIMRLSRAWAIAGLAYYVCTIAFRLTKPGGGISAAGILTLVILLGFINGVRGTFAYHRFVGAAGR